MERLLEDAERPIFPFTGTVIKPCREQVRHARPMILTVSARLRGGAPVDARGVAGLHQLLSDGGGPCYTATHGDALACALQAVSRALDVAE